MIPVWCEDVCLSLSHCTLGPSKSRLGGYATGWHSGGDDVDWPQSYSIAGSRLRRKDGRMSQEGGRPGTRPRQGPGRARQGPGHMERGGRSWGMPMPRAGLWRAAGGQSLSHHGWWGVSWAGPRLWYSGGWTPTGGAPQVVEWAGRVMQTLLPRRLLDIYGMSKPVLCSMLEVSKFYDR